MYIVKTHFASKESLFFQSSFRIVHSAHHVRRQCSIYNTKSIDFQSKVRVRSHCDGNCLIFSRAVALLFNWKYFWVEISCGRRADDVRTTREWDFTGGWHMSSTCHLHIVWKHACRPHGMATALHKAYWLPCYYFGVFKCWPHKLVLWHQMKVRPKITVAAAVWKRLEFFLCYAMVRNTVADPGGPEAGILHPLPVKISHKKMAAEASRIDFMFLRPLPPRSLDPLL